MIRPIIWRDGAVEIIDQRRLPARLVRRRCRTAEELAQAIGSLAVRGAPLIGVAAAYGAALAVWRSHDRTVAGDFHRAVRRLARTRPTAVNLFWALRRMEAAFAASSGAGVGRLRQRLLAEARAIHRDDAARCLAIARHGAAL
ncbi:MAG TPA: S-methyl-5-thioribose-1-phosphate isomerase, partial [Candidatus Edwardsbacteria bacterium]|nr:S-methyl-5-thioribose-1-phosphate isomerase [Candidatus Edwardsbacteria bacterium]